MNVVCTVFEDKNNVFVSSSYFKLKLIHTGRLITIEMCDLTANFRW